MCSTPKANQSLKTIRPDNVVSILSALDEDARQAFIERANKANKKCTKDSSDLFEHVPFHSVPILSKESQQSEPDSGLINFISDMFGKLLHR